MFCPAEEEEEEEEVRDALTIVLTVHCRWQDFTALLYLFLDYMSAPDRCVTTRRLLTRERSGLGQILYQY